MNKIRQIAGVTILGVFLFLLYSIIIKGKTIEEAFSPDNRTAKEIAFEARIHMMSNPFSMSARNEAEKLLKRAYERDNREPMVFVAYSQLALIHGYKVGSWFHFHTFKEKYVKKAYQLAWTATQLDPNHPLANAHLGKIFIIYEQYDKAQKYLGIAKKLNPKLFEAYYYTSQLKLRQSKYDEAYVVIEHAASLGVSNRHDSLVRNTKMEIARYNKDFELVEKYYLARIQTDPDNPYSYGNYGVFLKCMGRYDDSIAALEKAISLGAYGNAVKNLKVVKSLNNNLKAGYSVEIPDCGYNKAS